ncbi:hypothetical protein Tco_0117497 [Tanacetum coccineum]
MRFHRRPPAKGVGLRVADSHTGNHPEDDFTALETIQRSYSVIREKIPFEIEGETFKSDRGIMFSAAGDDVTSSTRLRHNSLRDDVTTFHDGISSHDPAEDLEYSLS